MVTRKDVARLAQVSVATVSFVVNNSKNVTPQVRGRVLDAIEELGYRPNLLARGLATKETRHVVMLVDNLINPHYCEMLSGAQSVASENGYIVSVISVDFSRNQDILDLTSRGVDGVILALSNTNPEAAARLGPSLPVVWPGRYITIDYTRAMSDMADHLLALGHRRIAFLSGLPVSSSEHARWVDWQTCLKDRGIPLDMALVVDGLPTPRSDEAEGYRAMTELLGRETDFTAVYAINDLMAVGALRAINERGLSAPKDVSLVGCDCLDVFRYLSPSLASMDEMAFELGRALMQSLMEEISHAPRSRHEIIVKYVPGESVGPAAR